MLTKSELEFCERVPHELGRIAEEIAKLRGAVEKCIGKSIPTELPANLPEKHTTDFDCLAVTKVEVFPKYCNIFKSKDLVLGLATVVINDQLTLQGLMICKSQETGLYVGYPTNYYFPMTRQLREHIENCVLEMYNNITK